MSRPSPAVATVSVGGKGVPLSSDSIYAVAEGIATVRIDSSALDKLSRFKPSVSSSSSELSAGESLVLTPRLSRAAVAVFLQKLILADSAAAVLADVSLDSPLETLDFELLSRRAGQSLAGISACTAAAAILDCMVAPLVRVSDGVAALSCESARADTAAAFDLTPSGDGFSIKDETDVAGDMRVFLLGSKLSGNNDSVAFVEIPSVHGSFREATRALHRRVRVELNSAVKVKKVPGGSSDESKQKGLLAAAAPLATGVKLMAESSLARSKLTVESISDVDIKAKVADLWRSNCPSLDDLGKIYEQITRDAAASTECLSVLQGLTSFVVKFKDILAWEASLCVFSLEIDDSVETALHSGTQNGEPAKGDKKGEKKKKKKTLGKGTSIVLQLLRDRVLGEKETSEFDTTMLVDWASTLSFYFDPKNPSLNILTAKVKEVVESNEVRRLPKIPKGTRDFGKKEMAIRDRAFSIITNVFKMHGATALDTPVFELRETLTGKYGEDSKLIYDLADQGGELCSLRYDLTVPFARYVAMNSIKALKRYQIAKVYRRDNPSKGRYREFYQCDFDIAGQYEPMEPDFEVIKVLTELLDRLKIGTYEVKLNHRKLLDGMLEICGVPAEKFRTICSSVDKLDKQPWDQIKKELVEEKGIAVHNADEIGKLVKIRGPAFHVLKELTNDGSPFMGNSGSASALKDLETLFRALDKAKCLDKIVFDLSLARGLDYYTGVIFEAVFTGSSTQVGSIAAGGRYDNLVGMFSGQQIPAVGMSLGIERVFDIMAQQEKDGSKVIRSTETQVLVAILAKDLPLAAEITSELWDANIKAEYKQTTRLRTHIEYAESSGIPWIVIVGESEVKNGVVKLKNMEAKQEEEVPRATYVEELLRRLS